MIGFDDKIVRAGLHEKGAVIGLADAEIRQLERRQHVTLPARYRQFLRECGRHAAAFASDGDFFYPAIGCLKHELQQMLRRRRIDHRLPDDAFVFSAYQGEHYCYFVCGMDDDPPVYRIAGDGTPARRVSASFSAYVDDVIDACRARAYPVAPERITRSTQR